MLCKVGEPKPPSGIRRLVFRMPILLYRLGLGGVMGDRFLLLMHTGRKSGLVRQTVVEVVRQDSQAGVYIVAAGWGFRSQWYQNIRADPNVTVQVGRRRRRATAELLPTERGEQEMLNYGQRNPSAAKFVARLMGYRIDGTDDDLRELGRRTPFVALHVGTAD